MAAHFPTQTIPPKRRRETLVAGLRPTLVPVAVGLASFVATELMHYLLVPDLGRLRERLLAEGLSAVVVALLTAGFIHHVDKRREAALLRMQVIAEMNHHIRNALAAISLSTDTIQNQQSIWVISQSVDRIAWALREVLPRSQPLGQEDQDRMYFFDLSRDQRPSGSDGGVATVVNSREETKWTRHT